MKVLLPILMFIIPLSVFTDSIDQQIKSIKKIYKIEVIFPKSKKEMSIASWTTHFEATSDDSKKANALKAISLFLEKHPKRISRKHLKKVYIMDKFSINQNAYAGTYQNNSIFAISRNTEKTLHHEFSSLLLKKYRMSQSQWKRVLPKGYKYEAKTGRNHTHLSGTTEELKQQGFIDRYGSIAFEEDFNRFSDHMFGKTEEMKSLIKDYPKIKAKASLIYKYYVKIDRDYKDSLKDFK